MHNEKGKFHDVAEILPDTPNVTIKVRVLRLWKFLDIEMVLADEKGGKIHATIKKQLIHMFESKLQEGQVYEMSSFTVFTENGSYRTTLHPYKLLFHFKTKVKPSQSSAITQFGLSFTNIGEIASHTHDYDFLVDVIDVMTGISSEREYIRDGKIDKMVIVELTDHSGKCECALFGDYVDELNKKMGKSATGLPIVVIQYAKIKIFKDKATIRNVFNATRIMVNPDIPEVDEFKNSIAAHGIECDTSVRLIGERKPAVDEEFLRMHPKKSVADLINSAEDGVFSVCAEVICIVDEQNWWYPACKCYRAVSVTPDSRAYFCSACDRHVFEVIPRFRVRIEVADGKAKCVLVLFDFEMSYMMGKSCAFFVDQSEAKNAGPHPVEFDSLIGKKMLFAVDRSLKKAPVSDYRVKRICLDPSIIQDFCSHVPFSTHTKKMCDAIGLDSDGVSDETDVGEDSQSLEFVNDLIVTSPTIGTTSESQGDVDMKVKRNSSKNFDGVAKKVKIEDD